MKKDIERIETKVDKIDERLDKVDKHLAVYNSQLETHIRSSMSNSKRLTHVENHMIKANFILKISGTILALVLGYIAKKYFGV